MAGKRNRAAASAWAELSSLFDHQRPRFLALIAEFELRPPQVIALRSLGEPRPMSEIATTIGCDRSSMTWIADRLEERELIRRVPAAGDRRVTLLELTPEGRRVREAIEARLSTPPDGFGSELSRAELETLRDLVSRLNAGRAAG
ncbi:MarR family transcriptional regulator [Thermoleophilia bacterium SCSIO 60948]|nr:MarR family transcriptional regulator [Thermoleophilia bacterium SCSIO 60948]